MTPPKPGRWLKKNRMSEPCEKYSWHTILTALDAMLDQYTFWGYVKSQMRLG